MLQPSVALELVDRFAFYDRAQKAFAVVHTGWVVGGGNGLASCREMAKYANIILKKGIVVDAK
jgi:L-fucose mutarotase